MDLVLTIGFCAYYSTCDKVSNLFMYEVEYIPIACLPIALCYTFLGDWLWSGNGMILAHTPRIRLGWISQWVYVLHYSFLFRSSSRMAIWEVSSSSTSSYSTQPSRSRSSNLSKCLACRFILIAFYSVLLSSLSLRMCYFLSFSF